MKLHSSLSTYPLLLLQKLTDLVYNFTKTWNYEIYSIILQIFERVSTFSAALSIYRTWKAVSLPIKIPLWHKNHFPAFRAFFWHYKLFLIRACSLIRNGKPIVIFDKTVMWLRSQRRLHVQGDAGHPGYQGGGQKKNNPKNGVSLTQCFFNTC
jgi:hypothetical protein